MGDNHQQQTQHGFEKILDFLVGAVEKANSGLAPLLSSLARLLDNAGGQSEQSLQNSAPKARRLLSW
jgi:hypothetical protein